MFQNAMKVCWFFFFKFTAISILTEGTARFNSDLFSMITLFYMHAFMNPSDYSETLPLGRAFLPLIVISFTCVEFIMLIRQINTIDFHF